MSRRARWMLWALLAAGTAGRLVVAFATHGGAFDIESYGMVADALREDALGLYGALTPASGIGLRWPYPPGYLPWVISADAISSATALPFHGVISLPIIAADAAIAWFVQDHLGRRGAGANRRLSAAALVAFGPSFAIISGLHGQHDAVAILPAVVAFWIWEHHRPKRRAVVCGLLIGLGAVIKTVPGLLLLALLPSCRTRHEAASLLGAAVAVPLIALLPWLIHDPEATTRALRYVGAPSVGGLTLALQPERSGVWLGQMVELNAALRFVVDHRLFINLALVAGLAGLLLHVRPPAVLGAVLLMLGVYSFGTGFFFQYLVWGMPFLLMQGYLRSVAAIQALAFVPTVLAHTGPWAGTTPVVVWSMLMLVLWLGFLAGFFILSAQARGVRPR